MADLSGQPCYRAIQQCMDNITETVIYDEVKDKVFAKELISLQDLDEYDRLTNIEAVRKMTRKVMRSNTGCEKFLKILQQMPQQQYKDLAKLITDQNKENIRTTEGTHTAQYVTCTVTVPLQEQLCLRCLVLNKEQTDAVCKVVPVEEILQDGKALIDTLLHQEVKMELIVEVMQLKRSAGKNFTDFLLYIIKLFQKAIENKTITLTNSVRRSIMTELNDIFLVLYRVRMDFCSASTQHNATQDDTSEDDTTSLDDSMVIVVRYAVKVKDIIKSLQKKQWLRCFRSAKNINTFIPIFEKITKVIEGIQCIEYRQFSELLGNVEELKASLDDINKTVLGLEAVGLSAAFLLAIGGFVCLIVGGILSATPAAPAGVPLMIAGGAGVGAALVSGCGTELCACLARKRLGHAEAKGDRKGKKFVKEDTTELSQPC